MAWSCTVCKGSFQPLLACRWAASPPPSPAPTWPPAEGRGEGGVVEAGLLLSQKLHRAAPAAQLAAGAWHGAAGGPRLGALRRPGAVVARRAVGAGSGALRATWTTCRRAGKQESSGGGLGGLAEQAAVKARGQPAGAGKVRRVADCSPPGWPHRSSGGLCAAPWATSRSGRKARQRMAGNAAGSSGGSTRPHVLWCWIKRA